MSGSLQDLRRKPTPDGKRIDGIGPVTRDGMPVTLRSEVRDANQSRWYKKMYDTIHKPRVHNDEYVTIRYKRKAQCPYVSGYLSEPSGTNYDSDYSDHKYATIDNRRSPVRNNEYTWPKESKNLASRLSGYESDSTLVFHKKETPCSIPDTEEQKKVYKEIQKGGEVPFSGLRKPAPEKPKDSSRKYLENEVTIHYKTPVRQEIKEFLNEDELAFKQAEQMKKKYEEERRRKYLQELQDANRRRHTDNFIPSQKSPISLNRYDDFEALPSVKKENTVPESQLVAKALYNFVAQTPKELTFRKGDVIRIKKQVDKNWYEGELNAMIGLFPANYVEIMPSNEVNKSFTKKPAEGLARAKYNFVAQTQLELTLSKGELVTLTKRIDNNWFEGRIGGRKGIFPVSYVEVLIDPNDKTDNNYVKSSKNVNSNSLTLPMTNGTTYGSVNRHQAKNPVTEALHIDTQFEPTAYRVLFRYLPQNDDELELQEGDTVYVLEKCDDGWFVGSNERTGSFGTFPGNYVEKL